MVGQRFSKSEGKKFHTEQFLNIFKKPLTLFFTDDLENSVKVISDTISSSMLNGGKLFFEQEINVLF